LGKPSEGAEVFSVLVYRLFPGNYLAAQKLFRALPKTVQSRPLSVLDVGAGSAAWSIPFAEANPRTRVVALDFGPVLGTARHFTRACGVEAQYTFRAGDLRRVGFGREALDVALLGQICHSEGAAGTRRLFRKVHQALRPGGLMLVADVYPDEERRGRDGGSHALLFALNMLVHSEQGDTFPVSEYRSWATAAGFRRFRAIALGGPAPVLLFQK
jgi:SAM-dependent methyltransferase